MKILKVCVGTVVDKDPRLPDAHYLQVESLNNGRQCWYLKKEIMNQLSQVNSLRALGLDVTFGFLSQRKSLLNLFQFGLRLRKIVKEKLIDLIHVDWGSTTAFVTVLFSPVPVIISFCGSDLMGTVDAFGNKTLFGALSSFISQIAALGAKRIITKSMKLREMLWRMSQKKCRVIPNGVDLSVFYTIDKDAARFKLGWSVKSKIIIFFPSGGAPVKDQPFAERIVKIVQSKISNLELRLIDNLPHEDLIYYYNAADLMLLTSRHEGSNNSLKEAMCCNLPIVAVDCGDTTERLDGVLNSYVGNDRDPEILADKVFEILKNGHRTDSRIKAESISLENIARRIKGVYEEVTA